MPIVPIPQPSPPRPSSTVRPRDEVAPGPAHLQAGSRWTWNRWPNGVEHDQQFRLPGRWALAAAEMLRNDPKLVEFSRARMDPILQARYEVVPGKGERAAMFADDIRLAFGIGDRAAPRMCQRSWSDIIEMLSRGLDVGFAVVEPLYGIGEDGKWWVRDVVDVEAYSITGFLRDATGRLVEVQQTVSQTGMGYGHHSVPADRILLFSWGMTGDNYVGCGALRPCWDWYKLKRDVPHLFGQALTRWSIPPLVATVCRRVLTAPMTAGGEGLSDEDADKLISAAQLAGVSMQAGETTMLMAYGVNGEGLKWEAMQGQPFQPQIFGSTVTECDRQMAAAFSAEVVEMGTKGEGSRAIGEVHLDVLKASLGNQLDKILEVFHGASRPGGGLFDRLLTANYGPIRPEELPQVIHHGLEVDGLADALGAVPSLVAAGMVTPNDLRDRVLRLLGAHPSLEPIAEPSVSLEGVPQVGGGGRPEGT